MANKNYTDINDFDRSIQEKAEDVGAIESPPVLKKTFSKQAIIVIVVFILSLVVGVSASLIKNRLSVEPPSTSMVDISPSTSMVDISPSTSMVDISPSTSMVDISPSTLTIEEYLKKGEDQNAHNVALKYSKENPDDLIGYKYLGITNFLVGDYIESTRNYELALKDPTLTTTAKAEINHFIGRNFHFLKDTETATSYFKTAIQLDPNYTPPYNALGLIALNGKNYNEALYFFEYELSLLSDSENNTLSLYAYYYLAKLYFETDNYPKAQQMIVIAKKLQQLSEPKITWLSDNIESLEVMITEKLTK